MNIERFAYQECAGRPRERGFAIDSVGTKKPEDTLHARRITPECVRFIGSVVEGGLLDRNGHSVLAIADALRNGNTPDVRLPIERAYFTYRNRYPMPSISIIGYIQEDGLPEVELERTRVFSRRFKPDCKRLSTSEAYKDSMEVARLLGMTAIRPQASESPIDRVRNARSTVMAFANFFNSQLTRWTIAHDIPQIMRVYPATIEHNGNSLSFAGFSADRSIHESFNQEHSRWSTPCTQLETWINMVNITSYLDEGEPVVDQSSMALIADWMNTRKMQKIITRNERQQQPVIE